MTDSYHGKLGCFYSDVFTWLEIRELFVVFIGPLQTQADSESAMQHFNFRTQTSNL